ncbi:MAG TPA: fimbria/pilus outer membrane usher protein [Dyella sp.]|uniref:fimbria/pilus outer membrane usher protein n=1 Tax=Dyella sp. TaxID=1869338 RepID=UPI002C15FA5D|nr:fimbria/pilus outer membrane usher protein [Dyella sp.]HTV87248.1 fimbria/pilus outer membrane usher protein [Dyella sp.]
MSLIIATRQRIRSALPDMWRRAFLPSLIASVLSPTVAYGAAAASSGADPATNLDPAVTFDANLTVGGSESQVDLTRFSKAGYVPPGIYHGDIIVNQVWRAHTTIEFAAQADGTTKPCFDAAALMRYGIDLAKVAADAANPPRKAMPQGSFCGNIGDYVPGATTSFDPGEQSLSFSVPQLYMSRHARGYVDPSQWDGGINADVLGYNANVYRSGNAGLYQANGYLGLTNALSFGSWHFDHTGALTWVQGQGARYQNTATYLQHDIPAWQAQVVVGDTFTSGDLFDSVRVRGLRMYTDNRMLPQSMRGYAPIVRGVADTNAHVVIRQNGYIIYDTTVAPGPFVIDDLYPTGFGGDLDVEVTEADGRVRRFTQPYSAVPQLLRQGQQLWTATAGRVNQTGLRDSPNVGQFTYQRGLSNLFTGYGGVTLATGYQSLLTGGAFNTPFGAFSADVTYASNHAPGLSSTSGYGMRLGYNQNFSNTGTNLGIATYRYATPGYLGLSDYVVLRNAVAQGQANLFLRQHTRMDITVNQSLGDRIGQLYLNASWRNYWNGAGRQVDFNAGYSNSWKSATYSVSVERTRDNLTSRAPGQALVSPVTGDNGGFFTPTSQGTIRDTRVMLNLTIPLGRPDRAPMLVASATHSRTSGSSQQLSLNGALDADHRYNYNATVGHSGGSTQGSLSGQYTGSRVNANASYSQGGGFRQSGLGAGGAVVVHAGGITFSPPTGDTVGLIEARGAAGARTGTTTIDGRGYAVVPYLMPYELNTIELDPKGTTSNVELKSTTQNVAPRAGSVVRLHYDVDRSQLLLIDARQANGSPLPFGADVFDAQGTNVGVVGQSSRLVVRGVDASTTLTVRWGAGANESCRLPVTLPANAKGVQSNTLMLQSTCGAPLPDGSAMAQPAVRNISGAVMH